ncbi:putative late blight resistance protein homolog R1A-3 [Cornus florida]|uniref:putative late blight resistance protein homolog R1A-3 n=1 Tax=Cornus florida TaxID=4283 RepID=UPI00289C04BE|nr:putative late blight resistance protein homolog R1A-3 [Cornus florida]
MASYIGVQQIGKLSNGASSRPISPTLQEETIVGFNDEATTIMELFTEEHEKQLKVVSIVGMPGLEKGFVAFQFRYDICQISDEKLGEDLHKRLKGRRYLLVVDDIWNVHAWDDLKRYFLNDRNGSRNIFTSQHEDENESWDLLRLKTFQEDSCPQELMETGKQIARKCQGLPLAIIVISGLLAKKDKTLEWWKHVAESHSQKTEIPVRQLIWLWNTEGFIWKNDEKSLEEVAEDYLMDPIDRSLVTVSKKRFNGAIKACRFHDLLHHLCLRKGQEENFLHAISKEAYVKSLLVEVILKLVLLRYLALHIRQDAYFPPSISNHLNLKILIVEGLKGLLVLSHNVWKLEKLRHLYTMIQRVPDDGFCFVLDDLQTLGKLHLYSGDEEALKWMPNLNKLKCCIRKGLNGDDHFTKLDFLIHLETLNVSAKGFNSR